MVRKESSAGFSNPPEYEEWRMSALAETHTMRLKHLFAITLLAAVASAKEPRHYQSGKLLKMQSVKCGTDEKNGKSLAGEMIGTDSSHMKTRELLCQEYVVQTDTLIYTIRPKDDKHPALLPVGEKAQFRLDKDKMLLRVEDMDDKEREYIVVSMVPRDSDDATISASNKEAVSFPHPGETQGSLVIPNALAWRARDGPYVAVQFHCRW